MTINLTTIEEANFTCPDCNATLPVNKGYITWCECGYNVQPTESEDFKSKLDLIYDSLGKKVGEYIFLSMKKNIKVTTRITFTKVIALLIATVVHLISISSFSLSIYLIINNSSIFTLLVGFFLLGVAWSTRPKIPKLSKGENLIRREDFPNLFGAFDKLADSMGVKKVDGIVINNEFNASVTFIGWKRKKIIMIGYPLFYILEPEEQFAIIAHEFGHIANGDITRSFFIGTALHTLVNWYQLLLPTSLDERENGGILEIPFYYFMILCSKLPYFVFYLLVHLFFTDKQKGEYFADYKAATACGSNHLISSLEKFNYYNTFASTVAQTAIRRDDKNLFSNLKHNLSVMPEREKDRLKLLDKMELSKLDSTHPPTYFRIQVLKTVQPVNNAFPIPSSLLVLANQELNQVKEDVQQQLSEDYRYNLG
ncbi:M48 family metalloprotease [Fredinandcohnia humi]